MICCRSTSWIGFPGSMIDVKLILIPHLTCRAHKVFVKGNNGPGAMLRVAMGWSSVTTLGKHPRCTRWHASATSAIKKQQPNLAGRRSPWGACLGEGASKHVESLRREGPRLHAFQRTIDYSVPRNISIRFLLWSVGTIVPDHH
jgi:hypothetical protein